MKTLTLAFTCALALTGCPKRQPPVTRTTHGAPVSPGDAKSIAVVIAAPDSFADKQVLVTGTVRAACQRKGCWMELAASDDKSQPGCRVTFKDYGFFVPTDSMGAQARVEGKAELRTVPADEVAHLEGEGAKLVKAADGTAKELRIVATGVELSKPVRVN
jgi:hypothetical protein